MTMDKSDVYKQFCEEDTISVDKLSDFLTALNISATQDAIYSAVSVLAGPADRLSIEQAEALCGMLSTPVTRPPGSEASEGDLRTPLKKVLTKNRYYLETGTLAFDPAVVQYMNKLEEHKKKCEVEGRYQEAKVAAKRLVDLKAAQVERTRTELVASQVRELQDVQRVFEEEAGKFDLSWSDRIAQFEASLQRGLEELRTAHERQLGETLEEQQRRRPQRARASKDYLHHRDKQDKLAKSGQYLRATKAKEVADELYKSDLDQTIVGWESECRLRMTKLLTRQQQEADALKHRGTKGRDALEMKRAAERERRALRFRNIVGELESLHRLEVVHLENFLDAQALAGKAVPLKDGFRRKREQILSSAF